MNFKFFSGDAEARSEQQVTAALGRSMARIEFDVSGNILSANDNFEKVMGYVARDIIGKHHSMFVPEEIVNSADYKGFWNKLGRGEFLSGAFPRKRRDGSLLWLEATYNPVVDAKGNITKIVKFASDITSRRNERALLQSVFDAISASQAVIEFDLEGNILNANNNFLSVMNYSLDEIKGRHHSLFVPEAQRNAQEYRTFWQNLNQGRFQAGQFLRVGKGGKEVWIEATYNPVLDAVGNPIKIIKFATDITEKTKLLINLKQMIDGNFAEIEGNIDVLNDRTSSSVDASENTMDLTRNVAASTEQMATSIAEISHSMAKSQTETERAFEQTSTANEMTQRMTGALEVIRRSVETVRDDATSISAAVTQQTAVTDNVSISMRDMAYSVEELTRNLEAIRTTTDMVASSMVKTRQAAEVLAR